MGEAYERMVSGKARIRVFFLRGWEALPNMPVDRPRGVLPRALVEEACREPPPSATSDTRSERLPRPAAVRAPLNIRVPG